jgi:hypothetical protein
MLGKVYAWVAVPFAPDADDGDEDSKHFAPVAGPIDIYASFLPRSGWQSGVRNDALMA